MSEINVQDLTSSKEPKLTNHDYDGIQEYDNPMPAWWSWIFILTVVFGAFYLLVFLGAQGGLSAEAFYATDSVEMMKQQYGQLGDVRGDEPTLVKLMHDEKWNKVGATIYQSNCVTCHGVDASGIAGPNLTDDSYINVKTLPDIYDVVNKGRKNGAMPAWGERLLPVERVLVSAYVASLRGQNKPSVGGRPAEGSVIAPWPEK